MNSLGLRIVVYGLVAVGIVWLGTGIVIWEIAHHELYELLDALPDNVRADLERERFDLVKEIAEHLATPLLLALPILGVLLWLAVTLALRPLKQLAAEIGARAPERLEPLLVSSAPTEIRPLIDRLNHLFADIGRALENERRFTADAAHELRTPLAAIKAQAQVAQSASADAERTRALINIVAGCDRATHLTEQLLMLARLDAPSKIALLPLQLNTFVPQALQDFASIAIDHGGSLEWIESPEFTINGDCALLTVLIRNLVENAFRHNPPGTHVAVSLSLINGHRCLVVKDNGPGVEDADQLIQKFRRSPQSGKGSGLGLSIVQRIARLHEAEFQFNSNLRGNEAIVSWQSASLAMQG